MLHGLYARVSILRPPPDGDSVDFEAGYFRHLEERAGGP